MAPNFLGMNFTAAAQAFTLSCKVSSTSSASCVQQETESLDGTTITTTVDGSTISTAFPGSHMATTVTSKIVLSYGSVTVTGGLDKLAQATGGSSSSSKGAAPRETGLGLLAMAAVAGAGMLV